MSVKALSSWRIATTSRPFFPISIQCIGFEAEYAVSIYTVHTVNTFIFRNFIDAIENDKPPQKCYLHASLEPHTIQEITGGANESIILMANGQLKFFQTPKKLVTVEYLSSVKTICSTEDGFALIKSSSNGMNFFVEIHPDKFQATEVEPRDTKMYDISFDNSNFQSSWHHSKFKIKQLHFPLPASNKFLARIFRDEIPLSEESNDRFLFFSIDNNLFSLQIESTDHFVIPIVTCVANIIDFWAAKNGKWIALLLNSGAMMLICLAKDGCEIQHELVYFGSEMTAFSFTNDLFIYSNDVLIEWMYIELNEEQVKFAFYRDSVSLPGIAALTILAEFSIAVAISENCQFYTIKLPSLNHRVGIEKSLARDTKKWYAVDSTMVKQLQKLKLNLIELTDAYDNLLDRQQNYRHMFEAIKLKRADEESIKTATTTTNSTRFVAYCLATTTPPSLTADEESQTINVVSPLVYDRITSFFVQISIVAVIYANEFNTEIWNLRCRWLNDMRENEYANVKLTKESLLQPLHFIIHLRQQYLPEFQMDVNTIVKIGESYVYLSFPVHVTQPNYCKILHVLSVPLTRPISVHQTELVCTMKLPQGIVLMDLFHEKTTKSIRMESVSYEIRLLGKRLTLTHQTDDTQCIELRCNDAGIMYHTKIHIINVMQQKCSRTNQIVHVTANALKEYSNFDTAVNVVCNLSQANNNNNNNNDNNNTTHNLLQCIGKIRLVPAIEFVK